MMIRTSTTGPCGRPIQELPNGGLLLAAFLVCALAVRDGLTGPSTQAASKTRQPTTKVTSTNHFEFHCDPWINLHHFLYQWARGDEGLATGRQYVPVEERSSLGELSNAQRKAWLQALKFYRESVAGRNHFDGEMLQLKQELLDRGGDPQATPPDRIQGIADALTVAMPIYRETWWPDHKKANLSWIAGVAPRLRRHEARYVEMTIRIYGAEWPNAKWRVDVSSYANWAAGYTAMGHIVIYSKDPGNQDLYALETILHEVQHTRALGSAARRGLTRLFEGAGTDLPRNLWHALIFATAGAFTRTVAETEELPHHTPYWIREGFENFRGWSTLIPLVREHWLPVVRGEASKEDGFAALVDSLGSG